MKVINHKLRKYEFTISIIKNIFSLKTETAWIMFGSSYFIETETLHLNDFLQ